MGFGDPGRIATSPPTASPPAKPPRSASNKGKNMAKTIVITPLLALYGTIASCRNCPEDDECEEGLSWCEDHQPVQCVFREDGYCGEWTRLERSMCAEGTSCIEMSAGFECVDANCDGGGMCTTSPAYGDLVVECEDGLPARATSCRGGYCAKEPRGPRRTVCAESPDECPTDGALVCSPLLGFVWECVNGLWREHDYCEDPMICVATSDTTAECQ